MLDLGPVAQCDLASIAATNKQLVQYPQTPEWPLADCLITLQSMGRRSQWLYQQVLFQSAGLLEHGVLTTHKADDDDQQGVQELADEDPLQSRFQQRQSVRKRRKLAVQRVRRLLPSATGTMCLQMYYTLRQFFSEQS